MLRSLLSHRRVIAVGAICALGGSAAGIAVSSAASGDNSVSQRHVKRFFGPFGFGPGGPGEPGPGGKLGAFGVGGGPVHGDFVVPNSAGNGFVTVTMDRGKVQSVSGNQLTITEGTETTTYKTVTLTIPSNATIVRDGQTAKLTDLKSGDEANVVQTPSATHVGAFSADFKKQLRQRFGQFRGFRREFHGRFGPPMPPPDGPGAPAPGPPDGPSYP